MHFECVIGDDTQVSGALVFILNNVLDLVTTIDYRNFLKVKLILSQSTGLVTKNVIQLRQIL